MATSSNNTPLRFIIGSFAVGVAAGVVFVASDEESEPARTKERIISQMVQVNPPNVELENEEIPPTIETFLSGEGQMILKAIQELKALEASWISRINKLEKAIKSLGRNPNIDPDFKEWNKHLNRLRNDKHRLDESAKDSFLSWIKFRHLSDSESQRKYETVLKEGRDQADEIRQQYQQLKDFKISSLSPSSLKKMPQKKKQQTQAMPRRRIRKEQAVPNRKVDPENSGLAIEGDMIDPAHDFDNQYTFEASSSFKKHDEAEADRLRKLENSHGTIPEAISTPTSTDEGLERETPKHQHKHQQEGGSTSEAEWYLRPPTRR